MNAEKYDFSKHVIDISEKHIPKSIREYYSKRNAYIYYSTKSLNGVPILKTSYDVLLRLTLKSYPYLKDEFEGALVHYFKGFNTGFESSFNPFIKTPETLKEMILIAVQHQKKGFPVSFTDINTMKQTAKFSESAFIAMGYNYGRNYRAWLYILQTPMYYASEEIFRTNELKRIAVEKPVSLKFTNLCTASGEKIIPQLKTEYYKAKPLEFAYMLKALFQLKLIQVNPSTYNVVELHRIIKDEFKEVGSRQSLSTNVKKDDRFSKDQLNMHIKRIKALL